ncbi:hypothetical protein WA158_003158 [Blastocystis sp. Blastoise]
MSDVIKTSSSEPLVFQHISILTEASIDEDIQITLFQRQFIGKKKINVISLHPSDFQGGFIAPKYYKYEDNENPLQLLIDAAFVTTDTKFCTPESARECDRLIAMIVYPLYAIFTKPVVHEGSSIMCMISPSNDDEDVSPVVKCSDTEAAFVNQAYIFKPNQFIKLELEFKFKKIGRTLGGKKLIGRFVHSLENQYLGERNLIQENIFKGNEDIGAFSFDIQGLYSHSIFGIDHIENNSQQQTQESYVALEQTPQPSTTGKESVIYIGPNGLPLTPREIEAYFQQQQQEQQQQQQQQGMSIQQQSVMSSTSSIPITSMDVQQQIALNQQYINAVLQNPSQFGIDANQQQLLLQQQQQLQQLQQYQQSPYQSPYQQDPQQYQQSLYQQQQDPQQSLYQQQQYQQQQPLPLSNEPSPYNYNPIQTSQRTVSPVSAGSSYNQPQQDPISSNYTPPNTISIFNPTPVSSYQQSPSLSLNNNNIPSATTPKVIPAPPVTHSPLVSLPVSTKDVQIVQSDVIDNNTDYPQPIPIEQSLPNTQENSFSEYQSQQPISISVLPHNYDINSIQTQNIFTNPNAIPLSSASNHISAQPLSIPQNIGLETVNVMVDSPRSIHQSGRLNIHSSLQPVPLHESDTPIQYSSSSVSSNPRGNSVSNIPRISSPLLASPLLNSPSHSSPSSPIPVPVPVPVPVPISHSKPSTPLPNSYAPGTCPPPAPIPQLSASYVFTPEIAKQYSASPIVSIPNQNIQQYMSILPDEPLDTIPANSRHVPSQLKENRDESPSLDMNILSNLHNNQMNIQNTFPIPESTLPINARMSPAPYSQEQYQEPPPSMVPSVPSVPENSYNIFESPQNLSLPPITPASKFTLPSISLPPSGNPSMTQSVSSPMAPSLQFAQSTANDDINLDSIDIDIDDIPIDTILSPPSSSSSIPVPMNTQQLASMLPSVPIMSNYSNLSSQREEQPQLEPQ